MKQGTAGTNSKNAWVTQQPIEAGSRVPVIIKRIDDQTSVPIAGVNYNNPRYSVGPDAKMIPWGKDPVWVYSGTNNLRHERYGVARGKCVGYGAGNGASGVYHIKFDGWKIPIEGTWGVAEDTLLLPIASYPGNVGDAFSEVIPDIWENDNVLAWLDFNSVYLGGTGSSVPSGCYIIDYPVGMRNVSIQISSSSPGRGWKDVTDAYCQPNSWGAAPQTIFTLKGTGTISHPLHPSETYSEFRETYPKFRIWCKVGQHGMT